MRLLIDHLKLGTVPHDLVEYFGSEVPFYEGCMIIQIHDHKSIAPSPGSSKATTGTGKTVLFSVHNYNKFLTPSSYVPFPTETLSPKGNSLEGDSDDNKIKSAEQKDKENMPAPAVPGESQRIKPTKKPSVYTIVLHPTPLSTHIEVTTKAITPKSTSTDSRQDANAPTSTILPPSTPILPQTPQTSMAPPAKRLKRTKMELDCTNIYGVESQITLATTAPLVLDPVGSATESARLLESLAHPKHSDKPPLPKTRKRTVAEMAADEAFAADQERYMLIMDERLSSSTLGAQGGANPADGDGQAGGASFEPRFERFKTIENIKARLIETKKAEKIQQQEKERQRQQDNEREKLRVETEKRDAAEKLRVQQQQQQQNLARQQQQEAHRRALASQAQQQNLQQLPPQMQQGQHGHPQPNGMPNGMQAQPQRFHQQQVSQAQMSSPIVRNGTPQSHGHSSPTVNNMGNIPMQHSTSSIGGSPPRPASVVHQNHPQMAAPMSQPMSTQRSQQSHGGTPRIPSATPNVQSTPLNRQMSQTPRMSQGSPLQGPVSQGPVMQQMVNSGQMPMGLNPSQQMQINQQLMQQRIARQNHQAAAAANGMPMVNGQQMSPQQFLQAQQIMQQRQQNNLTNSQNQISQQYAAQVAAMAQRQGSYCTKSIIM